MIAAWKEVFVRSGRYALLCPILFLVPLTIEMIQHWAEIHIGMYDSIAAAKAVEGNLLRMGIGHLKILSLFLTGYWAMRFFGFGDSAREATRLDPVAVRLFAWVLLWGIFWLVMVQDVPLLAAQFGVRDSVIAWSTGALILFSFPLELCVSAWKAGAALGNPRLSFWRSVAMIRGSFWWGLAMTFLTVIPLLVLHYVLFFVAIGKAPAMVWAIMALDSVVTAYLGVAMVAVTYVIARRMVERHGETLLPGV